MEEFKVSSFWSFSLISGVNKGVFFPFLLMKTGDSQGLKWSLEKRQQLVSCFLPVFLLGTLSCWAQPLTLLHPHATCCPFPGASASYLPWTVGIVLGWAKAAPAHCGHKAIATEYKCECKSLSWTVRTWLFVICISPNLSPRCSSHSSRDGWWGQDAVQF